MPDPTLLVTMFALLLVIGAFAGVLAGLLGVGGGIVLVPAFFYAFTTLGYGGPNLMQICLATSLATIVVTSLRSLHSHNRKGAVDWDILKTWAPGIVIGAVLGMLVAASVRSLALQILFGVLGIVVGLYLAFGKPEWRLAESMPTGVKRALLSPLLGFMSVLMGIGGGSFGVPLMTLYARPIHRAVATASGFGVLIAVPSVTGFLFYTPVGQTVPPYSLGAVNLPAFFVVIAMTLITTPLGVKLAHATDPKPLRRIFAAFLFLVALNMLRKALIG
ncbi:sulfite exporter TauE/SafE family protein [Pseudooceanicola sp.]|uniref:sulfite exporter TauE/SafE family protein n=1 Tax=Pseudooceanicola sp. TaxID=1914328 RepID=UPI0026268F2F|nr:sulfite exporter TauE/SafE family protein [Pseudooceanicola sp.]MDF1856088.1 sulfite exporter TauE/SafE family protein [Pseudooceanicola sp.]